MKIVAAPLFLSLLVPMVVIADVAGAATEPVCTGNGSTSCPSIPRDGFMPFSREAQQATQALRCVNARTTPASDGMGALYGCVQGRAETAKWFINEDAGRAGHVLNVKVMWNDYHRDIGEGLHADHTEAETMVAVLARFYAPALATDLNAAMRTNQDRVWEVGRFRIAYSYFRGPAIEERLFTVSENAPAALDSAKR